MLARLAMPIGQKMNLIGVFGVSKLACFRASRSSVQSAKVAAEQACGREEAHS
jgi:hypothetical protein